MDNMFENMEKEMIDLEKRKILKEFCKKHESCLCDCPLYGPVCRCGRGAHFLTKNSSGEFEMTKKEISAAYAIAFPESEPTMTELVEEGPDTTITICISGEHRISKIDIYFKED